MENYRKTIPYQLRDKVSKLHTAIIEGNEIRERASELLESLESETITNYLVGFGKTSGVINEKVKPKDYWVDCLIDVVKYTERILPKLKVWKERGLYALEDVKFNLMMLTAPLARMAIHEEEINASYRGEL